MILIIQVWSKNAIILLSGLSVPSKCSQVPLNLNTAFEVRS